MLFGDEIFINMKNYIKSYLERFSKITLFYRNIRDLLDRSQPLRKTHWGFVFSGHDSMAKGSFEPDETKLVRSLMATKDVLVNLGANVGYYCCHALDCGKPVIAVEPNVRNLHYLLKNIKSNGWSKMAEIYPIALGGSADILQMWGGGTGASLIKGWAAIPESYVTQVPVLSLDRLLGESLLGKNSLILVDIEGAEFMMLEGAKKTLINEPRPTWLVEISSAEHQPTGIKINPNFQKTFDLFFNSGYRAFTADESQREVFPAMVAQVMDGRCSLTTHNFIFSAG